MFRINEIHAFVAVDDKDEEGVVAFRSAGQWFPMIAADVARLAQLRPMAMQLAQARKQAVRHLKFTMREEIEVFE